MGSSSSQVVLFLRGDQPEAGVFDGEKIVAADGKRLKIASQAILARGPEVQGGQPRVIARQWGKKLEQAAGHMDVAQIWELMQDEGEMTADQLLDAWFGEQPGFEQGAALIVAVLTERIHFSRRKELLVPEPADLVRERLARARDVQAREQRLDALAACLDGGLDSPSCPDGVDPETWGRFIQGMKQVAVHGPEAPGTQEVVEVLRRARVNPEHGPFDLLVQAGVFHADENLDLIRHGIVDGFEQEPLREAERILETIAGEQAWRQGREDASGLDAVTVDSKATREVDDAISVKKREGGWELGVHIADVASMVRPGGPLWREAMVRGSTLYMPEGTVPMLPGELAEGGFSLDEGKDRPAVSLFVDMDESGAIRAHRFARTVLRVQRRLDYATADGLARSADRVLAPLARAGRALHEARLADGGVDLRLPELNVNVTPAGEIHVSVTRGTTAAHRLVSECAILYNRLAGRTLREHGLAGIYRCQPEPEDELPDTRTGGPVAELQARRMIPPSTTSTEPGRHYMLGVEDYATATSPIRRSFDLVVQHQLASILGAARCLTGEQVERLMLTAGPASRVRSEIERNRKRYWLLRHLHDNVTGRLLTGVVVDQMSDRILVHLPEYAMEVGLHTRDPQTHAQGELLEVRLDRANARRDTVRISLVG